MFNGERTISYKIESREKLTVSNNADARGIVHFPLGWQQRQRQLSHEKCKKHVRPCDRAMEEGHGNFRSLSLARWLSTSRYVRAGKTLTVSVILDQSFEDFHSFLYRDLNRLFSETLLDRGWI